MTSEAIDKQNAVSDELPPGTPLLHGQYVLERHLDGGGFGITYLAKDSLDRRVVIKECFPSALCCRVGNEVRVRSATHAEQYAAIIRHFVREAKGLAKLSHPNIVGVHQVFEENETAYMALDFVNGRDLLSVLEEEQARLTPEVIVDLLLQCLGAVHYLHERNILHRDLSPDNMLLDTDGTVTLIDFGASGEHLNAGPRARSALLAVKDGYSPQEFYLKDLPQGPSSDLYSLAATFYHLLTGQIPPQSQQRLAAIAGGGADPCVPLTQIDLPFDPSFLAAIDRALAVLPETRLQSASDWMQIIGVAPETPGMRVASRPVQSRPLTRTPEPPAAERRATPEIRSAISSLVAETNKGIDPADETRMVQTRKGPKFVGGRKLDDDPVDKGPKVPVDIFGNPIEDVDGWLAEQEAELEARREATEAAARAAIAAAEAEARAEEEAPRQSSGIVRGLIGRLAGSRSGSAEKHGRDNT